MSSTIAAAELVDIVAAEMALEVDTAVECWMAQIEQASTDPRLTTLGRMSAIKEVLNLYKSLTGKTNLHGRPEHKTSGPRGLLA